MKWTTIDWDDEGTFPEAFIPVLVYFESKSKSILSFKMEEKGYIVDFLAGKKWNDLQSFNGNRIPTLIAWAPIEEYEENVE